MRSQIGSLNGLLLINVAIIIPASLLFCLRPVDSPALSRLLLSTFSDVGVAHQVEAVLPNINGLNIRVAILDSGLSADHDALDNVVERLDFTSDGSADDKLGHGTFIAGVIAGSSPSCPGLAPSAHLHIYRVFTTDQTSYTAWFLDALNYALWAEVDVLNLSVGGPDHHDAPFTDKILELCSAGIVVVSAVGNDGPLYGTHLSPADLSCVIGVGGLNQDGSISSFSARGMTLSELHFNGIGRLKPDIVTLADRVQASASKGDCRTLSGTSVASPIVAGAAALLLSALPASSPLRNPAAIKQAMLETAERIAHVSMFEQGAGKMQIQNALIRLQSMAPHISASPPSIDFTDCPYFGPYCHQPLYADADPVIFNVTLLNSVAVEGRIELVTFTQDDKAVLDVRFSYPSLLWPWSGWLGIHIGVRQNVDTERVAHGTVHVVIRTVNGLHEIDIATKCRVIPTPDRSRRILWDQYHNVQFPLAFVPRDNLQEKVDTLDWHGDHPYTNFYTFYTELRSSGFFIEVLNRDLTCFIADRYSVLMIVDPERPFFSSEIAKIHNDVSHHGLSLFVIADWFNRVEMQKARLFDKNTQRWWEPLTGGSNIPAINDLLRPFDVEFSDDVIDGTFRIQGRPVSVHSGSSLNRFPTGGLLMLTSSLSSSQRRSNIAIGGVVMLERSRIVVYGDSNGVDDAQMHAASRSDWLMILLLNLASTGLVGERLIPALTTLSQSYDGGGTPPTHLDVISTEQDQGSCFKLWRIPIPFHDTSSGLHVSSDWLDAVFITSMLVLLLLLFCFTKRRQSYRRLCSSWLPISQDNDRTLDRRK